MRCTIHCLLILASILGVLTPLTIAKAAPPTDLAVNPGTDFNLDAFPPNQVFTLIFNQPMDPESSPAPLQALPSIIGSTEWDSSKTRLSFTPSTPYQPGQRYIFFIDPALTSQSGEKFSRPPYWQVRIAGGASVETIQPIDNPLPTRTTPLVIQFAQPMQPDSVSAALTITPTFPYTLTWTTPQTLQLIPTQALDPGTRYRLTIPSTALSEQGIPLDQPFTHTFWTESFNIDLNLQGNGGPVTAVVLDFSFPIDPQATGLPFAFNPPLAGDWLVTPDQAVFTLAHPLPFARQYSLRFTDPLVDQKGSPLPVPPVIPFSPLPPVSEPIVEEAKNSSRNVAIRLAFTVPVDHASVEAAFGVEPTLYGTFSWEANSLIFTPYRWLGWGTYQVSLSSAARTADNQPLISTTLKRSLFVEGYPAINFGGYGSNIQVIDPNGSDAIRVQSSVDAVASFELFAVTPDDYARFIANNADWRPYNYYGYSDTGRLLISTSELTPLRVWHQRFTAPSKNHVNISETFLPDDIPSGLYLLNVVTDGYQFYDQIMLVVSANNLAVKISGQKVFVWVSHHGAPVPEAEVTLFSSKGEKLRQGTADLNGFYRTTIPDGYTASFVLTHSTSGDTTLSMLDSTWQEYASWEYTSWDYTSGRVKDQFAYLYTDRPLYRPGQEVSYKLILRNDLDARYTLPETGTVVDLTLTDARGNVLERQSNTINSFGTLNGIFTLSESAGLGEYDITASAESTLGSITFLVEEYRKPEYEVVIDLPQGEEFLAGDEIRIDAAVNFLSGQPVNEAKVTARFFNVVDRSYYWWGRWDSPRYYWEERIQGSDNAQADAAGHAILSFKTKQADKYDSQSYWNSTQAYQMLGIVVSAEDGSGQVVSTRAVVKVYQHKHEMSLDTGSWLKEVGNETRFDVALRTWNGDPLPAGQVKIKLEHYNWKTGRTWKEIYKEELTSDSSGLGSFRFTPLEAGTYRVQVNFGSYALEDWFFVVDANSRWERWTEKDVEIYLDQDFYKPYQTAQIMIESSFSGPAILTFERQSVVHSIPITLTAPLTIINTTVIPEFAPNVFVTLSAWKWQDNRVDPNDKLDWWEAEMIEPDYELVMARAEMHVDASQNRLDIQISTDKSIYEPGEEAIFTIDVQDAFGRPAVAELSLSLVDEAIYKLGVERSKPIFEAFYGRRGLAVRTYHSSAPWRSASSDPGGRGGGGGGPLPPREDFPDTLAWLPVIRTDANGRAVVHLKLPDTLTSWRATVRAVTLSTRVGEATLKIFTQLDTVVRPVFPPEMNTGDEFTLRALLHNYLPFTRTLTVTLDAPGLSIQESLTQTITISSNSMGEAAWSAMADQAGESTVTIAAGDEHGTDAVRLPLMVNRLAQREVNTTNGVAQGAFSEQFFLPGNLLPESAVTLKLSLTPANGMLDGLSYLTGYPYGCVEQTMSRALPNAVVSRAARYIGVPENALPADLDKMIKDGIARLYAMQHGDGGWGWWADDDSDEYQTAWVLFGLSVTNEAGYPVSTSVLHHAANYLTYRIDKMDPRLRAFALYSLSTTDLSYVPYTLKWSDYWLNPTDAGTLSPAKRVYIRIADQLVDEELSKLDDFSLAALTLAYFRFGEEQKAQDLLEILSAQAVVTAGKAWWTVKASTGDYDSRTMASSIRTTALVLNAFLTIDPTNPLIEPAVAWLASKRQFFGWGTTNETSFTLLTLTDYLVNRQRTAANLAFTLTVNEETSLSGVLSGKENETSLEIPFSALKPGLNDIKWQSDRMIVVYYTLASDLYSIQSEVPAAGEITVKRQYFDMSGKTPLSQIRVGDIVTVKLTFKLPRQASFLILEDHLPAGLQAINEGMANEPYYAQNSSDYEDYYNPFWKSLGYNYKEIRGPRVTFFITRSAGEKEITITYKAWAVTTGVFNARPLEMYAMYETALWGRTSSDVVIVSNEQSIAEIFPTATPTPTPTPTPGRRDQELP